MKKIEWYILFLTAIFINLLKSFFYTMAFCAFIVVSP